MAPVKRLALVLVAVLMVATVPSTPASAAPSGAQLEFIAGGFPDSTMELAFAPGDDRMYLVELAGRIRIIEQDGTVLPQPFLDIASDVRSIDGMVFHPDYENNGIFYINTVEDGLDSYVLEYQVSANPNVADPSSRRVLLQWLRESNAHRGGQMMYGPDDYLYVAYGDGGPPPGDPFENGQDINTLDSTIIKIDPVTGAPAPDNPFVGLPGRDEIWTYGFRNPWRASFDRVTNLMYVGDVGDGDREEVNVIALNDGGNNYGWDVMEGSECFEAPEPGEAPCGDVSYVLPDFEYPHSGADGGCAVIGGFVYHGTQIPQMQDQYFYADYCRGTIKSFEYVNGQATNHQDWTPLLGAITEPSTWGQDNAGELYVVAKGDIFKIVPDGPGGSVGAIQGTVWSDTNENGLQNAEPGVANVGVELWLDSDEDGSPDVQLNTDTTDGGGGYSFVDLATTSTYLIRFVPPSGTQLTLQNVGGDDTVDSDPNPASGFTDPITLTANEVDDTVDAGLIAAASGTIGGRAWSDQNGDGIQDGPEPGLSIIWAWLYTDDDGNGTPDTKVAALKADSAGNYSFDVDPALSYFILFGQQIFIDGELTLVLPNGMIRSPFQVGADPTVDSDADPTTGFAGPLSVNDGDVDLTIDAGFVPISGAYGDIVIGDGAVAYWRLGEQSGTSALDTVGGNDGFVSGAPDWGQPGFVGGTDTALRVNGGELIAIPDSTDINLGGPFEARSVEVWFAPDDTGPRQVIYEEGGTARGLAVYIEGGSVYGGIWNRTDNGDGTTPWASDVWLSAPVAAGSTSHLVVVYDFAANAVTLYVNGTNVDSATGVGRWFAHGDDTGIAAINGGTRFVGNAQHLGNPRYFSGVIDEVAVYPGPLSASQVQSHFTGALPNVAPVVDAGPDFVVTLPALGALDGTVSDDGLPFPPGVTTSLWTQESGPGVATFGDAGFANTSVEFSAPGTYVLRLTADDGDLTDFDELTVTVNSDGGVDYSSVVLADNPIAYWRFEELGGSIAADSVGTGDASIVGGIALGQPGLVSTGSAFRFDGGDGVVAVPDIVGVNLGGPFETRSVELWFEADDVGQRQVLYEEGSTARGLSITLDGGQVYGGLWNRTSHPGDASTPWPTDAFVATPVAPGVTYHVVLVYSMAADAVTLYVNGVEVDTVAGVGRWYGHGGDIGIGAIEGGIRFFDVAQTVGNLRHFAGLVDEVAVYDGALTGPTISSHYSAGQ